MPREHFPPYERAVKTALLDARLVQQRLKQIEATLVPALNSPLYERDDVVAWAARVREIQTLVHGLVVSFEVRQGEIAAGKLAALRDAA